MFAVRRNKIRCSMLTISEWNKKNKSILSNCYLFQSSRALKNSIIFRQENWQLLQFSFLHSKVYNSVQNLKPIKNFLELSDFLYFLNYTEDRIGNVPYILSACTIDSILAYTNSREQLSTYKITFTYWIYNKWRFFLSKKCYPVIYNDWKINYLHLFPKLKETLPEIRTKPVLYSMYYYSENDNLRRFFKTE